MSTTGSSATAACGRNASTGWEDYLKELQAQEKKEKKRERKK